MEVVTGPDGILEGCHKETRVICMSTIDKKNLESVAGECAKKGVGFVDCPVTGGPARVAAGTLTLIVAGHLKAFWKNAALSWKCRGRLTTSVKNPDWDRRLNTATSFWWPPQLLPLLK